MLRSIYKIDLGLLRQLSVNALYCSEIVHDVNVCLYRFAFLCAWISIFFLLSIFPQHYLGNLSLERIYSALTHAMHTWQYFVTRYTHQHTQTSTELNNRNRKCNCNTTAVTHTSQLLWRLLNHLNVCRREACSWCNVFIRMSWNRMEHNLTFSVHTSNVRLQMRFSNCFSNMRYSNSNELQVFNSFFFLFNSLHWD